METLYNSRKNFIINTVYFLLILFLIYLFFEYILSLISPFLFAFIIAYILRKPAKILSSNMKLPQKVTSFILVLLFYSTVGVIVSLVGVKLISTISNIISSLPYIYENQLGPFLIQTFNAIEKTVYKIDPALVEALNEGFNQFVSSLGKNISNISIAVVSSLSDIASSLPGFLIKILLMVISTFFMAMDFDILTTFIKKQLSKRGFEILDTIRLYVSNTLFVVIRSYILIMSITFIELSIGLNIVGIPNAILIALIISIFDILPVLGTGGVMIPWTVMSFLQGDFKMGIGLLTVYLFVTIVRNILEPKIVGGQLGIHPVVAIVGMFVGANLLGVIGLFGVPITLSLIKHLNDKGTIKVFK
ncbi:sporulation integral membrane protein YtvI [Acetoanaerobium noterae]|uniref:sporulation integral membrane protein YtvI n=1 Tax=Acetoanaerobium noterae TaxID=745369 RepID=UPI0033413ECA